MTSQQQFRTQQNFFGRTMGEKMNTTGNFENYHRTITQMRDEMMKSIPKF